MAIHISPGPLKGHVHIIGSKSLSHRSVIAASLARGVSQIEGVMDAEDLDATRMILEALGARFEKDRVEGPLDFNAHTLLNAKASGSTLRFLIPLLLTQTKRFVITGEERLPYRSLMTYQTLCQDHGMDFKPLEEGRWLPLEIEGPLKPGVFHLDGSISSQFISGMLFALPLLEGDSTIRMTTPLTSKPYVDMTIDVLKTFGIDILTTNKGFHIKGR